MPYYEDYYSDWFSQDWFNTDKMYDRYREKYDKYRDRYYHSPAQDDKISRTVFLLNK